MPFRNKQSTTVSTADIDGRKEGWGRKNTEMEIRIRGKNYVVAYAFCLNSHRYQEHHVRVRATARILRRA